MGGGEASSEVVKGFCRQTGQQELAVWSKGDASLSLNFLALPECRDEGRALYKSLEIRDPVLADSAGLHCLMSKPHVLL